MVTSSLRASDTCILIRPIVHIFRYMKRVDTKIGSAGIVGGALNSLRTKNTREQTLEEIVDGFIDSNPIIYERLSKL